MRTISINEETGTDEAMADALERIAELIRQGYTSGHEPSWTLEGEEEEDDEEEEDPFESYDEDEYDVEAMRMDAANNNFSEERAEEYRHTAIVDASIINGQFRQAREQCQRYGLSYEEALVRNDRDPAAH